LKSSQDRSDTLDPSIVPVLFQRRSSNAAVIQDEGLPYNLRHSDAGSLVCSSDYINNKDVAFNPDKGGVLCTSFSLDLFCETLICLNNNWIIFFNRYMVENCINGICHENGCQCAACWKGMFCDLPGIKFKNKSTEK